MFYSRIFYTNQYYCCINNEVLIVNLNTETVESLNGYTAVLIDSITDKTVIPKLKELVNTIDNSTNLITKCTKLHKELNKEG